MKKSQSGFTLIELMIVVAIIGILSTLAMSAYQTYSVRAQVAEGLNLAGPVQSAIAEFNNDRGTFPADNTDAALLAPSSYEGRYVAGISVAGAVVSIQYGNSASAQIAGETVTLTAQNVGGSLIWNCATGGVIRTTFLPAVCR